MSRLAWIAAQAAQREDMVIDDIDLAQIDLPFVLPRHPGCGCEGLHRTD